MKSLGECDSFQHIRVRMESVKVSERRPACASTRNPCLRMGTDIRNQESNTFQFSQKRNSLGSELTGKVAYFFADQGQYESDHLFVLFI
mmetsp:Transcript_39501/g.118576  ORF Transcript_39501/g.118576 Transcript_39501/m.118576 type:complete len:89 (+) Transcript_39501:722-988(+)